MWNAKISRRQKRRWRVFCWSYWSVRGIKFQYNICKLLNIKTKYCLTCSQYEKVMSFKINIYLAVASDDAAWWRWCSIEKLVGAEEATDGGFPVENGSDPFKLIHGWWTISSRSIRSRGSIRRHWIIRSLHSEICFCIIDKNKSNRPPVEHALKLLFTFCKLILKQMILES